MPWAAARRAGTRVRARPSRGCTVDSAATTAPSRPRTGTATPVASGCTCPSVTTWPSRRTRASRTRNRAGSVTVADVRRSRGAARTRSCWSGGAWASRTRPDDETCSGSRPAIRVRLTTAPGAERRSRKMTSSPSRTPSCTWCPTTACRSPRNGSAAARRVSVGDARCPSSHSRIPIRSRPEPVRVSRPSSTSCPTSRDAVATCSPDARAISATPSSGRPGSNTDRIRTARASTGSPATTGGVCT